MEAASVPVYVYECQTCGHRMEQLQKHNDPGPDACEACESESPPERVKFPGGSSFALKGTCWGRDGYASGNWSDHQKPKVR